ncbi:MAG TPA: hypothetical protein VNN22_18240 [Verrucomicrobiae bacterium]|nr:hypothetical protein [Verrucomicrobiae bacterium]
MKIIPQKALCLAALLLLTVAGSAFAGDIVLPPHPRLLLNSNGIVELRERIASGPWAKSAWEELKASAGKSLLQPIELPPRGGNWSHNYVCPVHGARRST